MATTLDEEIKKRRAAAALLDTAADDSGNTDSADGEDSVAKSDDTESSSDTEETSVTSRSGSSYVLTPADDSGASSAQPDRKTGPSYVLTPVRDSDASSPEAAATTPRAYHTELAPPGEMDLRPDDAAPRAEAVSPRDAIHQVPLVSIGPKAVPEDQSKDVPLPAVTVEGQTDTQGETPKFLLTR